MIAKLLRGRHADGIICLISELLLLIIINWLEFGVRCCLPFRPSSRFVVVLSWPLLLLFLDSSGGIGCCSDESLPAQETQEGVIPSKVLFSFLDENNKELLFSLNCSSSSSPASPAEPIILSPHRCCCLPRCFLLFISLIAASLGILYRTTTIEMLPQNAPPTPLVENCNES